MYVKGGGTILQKYYNFVKYIIPVFGCLHPKIYNLSELKQKILRERIKQERIS
jgi:hypothetical protein